MSEGEIQGENLAEAITEAEILFSDKKAAQTDRHPRTQNPPNTAARSPHLHRHFSIDQSDFPFFWGQKMFTNGKKKNHRTSGDVFNLFLSSRWLELYNHPRSHCWRLSAKEKAFFKKVLGKNTKLSICLLQAGLKPTIQTLYNQNIQYFPFFVVV